MFPPIDTDLFSPFDRQAAKALLGLKDKRVILYMGNLEHRRFPDRLIDLLSPVFKMHEDAFLLILTTPTRSNIGRVAQLNLVSKRCGVERSVRIAAKYLKEEEKSLLYRSCETFLFPPISFHAGAVEPPLTVLESLSSGLPVIATDVLSVGEVVTDGHNGFVVPIDKYDCLPYRVNRLLEMDPGQWQTLSVHARGAAVENFSLRSACKKFGNFNESLVG
jgi:glycosyltransferase involved in cell wall biosynthesis